MDDFKLNINRRSIFKYWTAAIFNNHSTEKKYLLLTKINWLDVNIFSLSSKVLIDLPFSLFLVFLNFALVYWMSGNISCILDVRISLVYWMSGYFLYTRCYAISIVYWMSGYLLCTGCQVISLVYWMSGNISCILDVRYISCILDVR